MDSIMREPEPVLVYGIDAEGLEIEEGEVERNQFLHNILFPHGVSAQQLDDIGRRLKDTFDVRYMKAGKKYTLLLNDDSAKTARYFI